MRTDFTLLSPDFPVFKFPPFFLVIFILSDYIPHTVARPVYRALDMRSQFRDFSFWTVFYSGFLPSWPRNELCRMGSTDFANELKGLRFTVDTSHIHPWMITKHSISIRHPMASDPAQLSACLQLSDHWANLARNSGIAIEISGKPLFTLLSWTRLQDAPKGCPKVGWRPLHWGAKVA